MPAVLGEIVERNPTTISDSNIHSTSYNNRFADVPSGFPKATHRSESAFARARAAKGTTRFNAPPLVSKARVTSTSTVDPLPARSDGSKTDEAAWKEQISRENDSKIEQMTEGEREKEREDIISQFGPDIVDLVTRMRERRGLEGKGEQERPKSAMAHSRSSTAESTPSTKAARRLRFANEPAQVYVYESEPSSPKKRALALPPPPGPAESSEDIVSLGTWKGKMKPEAAEEKGPTPPGADEGDPDVIREKYFPNEPPPSENPSLAWMLPSKTETPQTQSASGEVRYDLQGRVIPKHLIHTLPSHLGLHHHGDSPEHAGYTLDEMLMLSRSTLPAQRATMLLVLGKLIRRFRDGQASKEEADIVVEIAQKCLTVAIEAFGDRASTHVRIAGLDILWHALAYAPTDAVDGMSVDGTQLDTLPLAYFFECALYNTRTIISPISLGRLLEVFLALININPKLVDDIVGVDGLLNGAVRSCESLRLEEVARDTDASVEWTLLRLVRKIAQFSRQSAQALIPDVSDAFLKTLLSIPELPNQSRDGSTFIVCAQALELYGDLGRYGLGSSIASNGHPVFRRLQTIVTENILLNEDVGATLVTSWLHLHEVWIACALNPHNTTPEHDLLWSQLAAWGWRDGFLALRKRLMQSGGISGEVWGAWWRCWTMWIKAAQVNEADRGEGDVQRWRDQSSSSWTRGGAEWTLVEAAIAELQSSTFAIESASVLHSALLLWMEVPNETCPWSTNVLSEILRAIGTSSVWTSATTSRDHSRLLNNLCTTLIRHLEQSLQDQVLMDVRYSTLQHLLPGDEMLASELISGILKKTFAQVRSKLTEEFWVAAGGPEKVLLPLYQYALWPKEGVFISPLVPHPTALKMTTTFLSTGGADKTPSGGRTGIELPQRECGDWMDAPLDVLLRSGSTHSRLFRTLPQNWTASETEVVQRLLLLLVHRQTPLSRSRIIFICMKVFMLEHGQSTDSGGEVYRDPLVVRLLSDFLMPLRYSNSRQNAFVSHDDPSLEAVAAAFLGPDQPFFQFYTDFLGLYDSASFGHALFGTLLLPPTSSRYARDYRRLLWLDHGHVLRSIRVDVEDALCTPEELKGWLWPVEGIEDGEMLGGFLKAILKGNLSGFLRFLAVHQIATCLWPDMVESGKRSENVLRALLASADEQTLKEMLSYHQPLTDTEIPLVPPACHQAPSDVVSRRLEWIKGVAGEDALKRFPHTS